MKSFARAPYREPGQASGAKNFNRFLRLRPARATREAGIQIPDMNVASAMTMNPNCLPAPYLAYGRSPVVQTPRKQRTIAEPASLSGFGYWSGKDVRVEFRPAPENTGIIFVRSDLLRRVRIPASVINRIDVPRRTTLVSGGATVEMVEHLLAALYGLQIDNCEVWIDQPELPGCDGSSQPFVECLDRVGTVAQGAWRSQVFVNSTIRVGTADSWIEARPATPGSGLSARYRLDYGLGNAIGRQTYQVHVMPETFRSELAPCRTFMLKAEAEWLLAQGLGQRDDNARFAGVRYRRPDRQ